MSIRNQEMKIKKKILCNISGHELPLDLENNLQLIQTYTKILTIFDEIHFICRSTKCGKSQTISHSQKPIHIHFVKVSNNSIDRTLGAILRLFFSAISRKKKYNISHFLASDTTIGGIVCSLLKIFIKAKFILEVQGEMTRISKNAIGWRRAFLYKQTTILSSRFAFLVRAVSETVKQQLIEDGINPRKIRVVTSRVDINNFDFLAHPNAQKEIKQRFNISEESKLFVLIGRLVVFKGITFLLQALQNFNKIPFKLLIVGDGILRSDLETEAAHLGLKDKVIFAGEISYDKIPYYISAADIIFIPSTDEGFPRVMLEAMAMKKLIAASLVGGIKDIAINKFNGYFFPPQNPSAIFETLNIIFEESQIDFCIENGYKLVVEKYEFNVAMNTYLALLRELIGN